MQQAVQNVTTASLSSSAPPPFDVVCYAIEQFNGTSSHIRLKRSAAYYSCSSLSTTGLCWMNIPSLLNRFSFGTTGPSCAVSRRRSPSGGAEGVAGRLASPAHVTGRGGKHPPLARTSCTPGWESADGRAFSDAPWWPLEYRCGSPPRSAAVVCPRLWFTRRPWSTVVLCHRGMFVRTPLMKLPLTSSALKWSHLTLEHGHVVLATTSGLSLAMSLVCLCETNTCGYWITSGQYVYPIFSVSCIKDNSWCFYISTG